VEAVIHLDTHVVAWLYAGVTGRMPPAALAAIEREAIAISPIVLLELEYLHEVGRIAERSAPIREDLGRRIGLSVSTVPFAAVVERAVSMTWTRDPFDRLIAGQALAEEARLLTADESIRANVDLAIWD
jgi:PIN domain nuclease of toxin-antitoxin system